MSNGKQTSAMGDLFKRAVAAQAAGRMAEAATLYEEVLQTDPVCEGALTNLGAIARAEGRLDDAVVLLSRASQIPNASGETFFNLSNALEAASDAAGALVAIETAVERSPRLGQAHLRRGLLLDRAGRSREATSAFLGAAEHLSPNDGVYRAGLGAPKAAYILFSNNHRMEGVAMFRTIAAARPKDVHAQTNLAVALFQCSLHEEAIAAFQRARALDPSNAHALTGIPNCYMNIGKPEKAYALYEEALANPDLKNGVVSSYLMALLYDGRKQPEQIAETHRALTQDWTDGKAPVALPTVRRYGALRVGYMTADLVRTHPVAQFIAPVLRAHRDTRIHQIAYLNAGNEDRANTELTDLLETKRVAEWEDERLAEEIAADRVDILVDLAGHTRGNRLKTLGYRPAPVSACFIGYPHSTGFSAIDYLIADGMVCPPEHDPLCSERVIRLPNAFLCFSPPPDMPEPTGAHPKGPVVFGSLNHLLKLGPETVALWSGVLKAVPDSRLFLKCGPFAEESVRERFLARFASAGIARHRLTLEGPDSFGQAMRAYERIDVALDPIPYNGGTTTVHALWMGVPVVSMIGGNFCGRMGASLLSTAGFPELVAEDRDQYIARAAQLAADVVSLRANRRRRHARTRLSKLCDVKSYADALTKLYHQMANR